MAPDRVEETAYFQGKSLEFVADWLEKNNLSKLKSVFKGTFIINCYTKVRLMGTRMDGIHITNIEIFLQRTCMKQMHGFILNRDLSPVFL